MWCSQPFPVNSEKVKMLRGVTSFWKQLLKQLQRAGKDLPTVTQPQPQPRKVLLQMPKMLWVGPSTSLIMSPGTSHQLIAQWLSTF